MVYEIETLRYTNVTQPPNTEVSKLTSMLDTDIVFPVDFSFFEPYIQYFIKEVLETDGEAYISRNSDGKITGLFLYDNVEKSGSIYTRSMEVFNYFFRLKSFNFLFAELKTEVESEVYDIYMIDLENHSLSHSFSYEIAIVDYDHTSEIERFMVLAHPGMNRKWTGVALKNGDKCFTVRLDGEVAGLGWVSFVNGVGRLHSLFVKPQFRKLGIGEDILYARLLWLKSKHARYAFSEISRFGSPFSARIASKAQMRVIGQVFRYLEKGERAAKT